MREALPRARFPNHSHCHPHRAMPRQATEENKNERALNFHGAFAADLASHKRFTTLRVLREGLLQVGPQQRVMTAATFCSRVCRQILAPADDLRCPQRLPFARQVSQSAEG